MATDKKITDLPTAGTVNSTDWVPIVQGGVNKKAAASNMPGSGGITGTAGYIPYMATGSTTADSWLKRVAGGITIDDGKYLSSENGLIQFDFGSGAYFALTTDGGVFNECFIYGDGDTAQVGHDDLGVSVIRDMNAARSGASSILIKGNVTNDATSNSLVGSHAVIINSSDSTINAGVSGSVIIGGSSITATEDDSVYISSARIIGIDSTSANYALKVGSSTAAILTVRNDNYTVLSSNRFDIVGTTANATMYFMSPAGTVDPTMYFYQNGGTLSGFYGATNTSLVADGVSGILLKVSGSTKATINSGGIVSSGYLELAEQASAPSTPTNALRLFADSSNRFSWIGENGYTRTFDGTANTANRTYTLPNASGVVMVEGVSRLLVDVEVASALANSNPVDSTTVYIGQGLNSAPNATASRRKFKLKTGVLRECKIYVQVNSAVGTSEATTFNLRNITDSTSTLISNAVTFDAFTSSYSITGLSISVDSSKDYAIEIVYPVFATNPSAIQTSCTMYVYNN
jgi:hypothetical protein